MNRHETCFGSMLPVSLSFGWPGAVAHSEVKLFQKAFLKIARQPSTGFVIVFVFVISSVFTFVLVFVFVFVFVFVIVIVFVFVSRCHF